MTKIILTLSLMIITCDSFAQQNELKWLSKNLITLHDVLPVNDYEDFKKMNHIITGKKVIAMGEASHGQGSFFTMKHKMFRFLVNEHKFNIFAIEAGFSEALSINKYVLSGEGDSKSVLHHLGYGVWNNQETIDLIEWMREYNKDSLHTQKLQFYGFDCQFTKDAANCVLDFLQKYDSKNFENSKNFLNLFKETGNIWELKTEYQNKLDSVYILSKIFEQEKDRYSMLSGKEDIDLVVHNLRILIQALEMYKEDKKDIDLRPKFMAENVGWILEHNKDSKIMLWAHNGHVSKSEDDKDMGFLLNKIYKDSFYSIGFEFNQGGIQCFKFEDKKYVFYEEKFKTAKKGSLPNLLSRLNIPILFINLNSENRPLWFENKQYCSDVLGNYGKYSKKRYSKIKPINFDGIIFIETTERSHGFVKDKN
jgi:erythromycin esterase